MCAVAKDNLISNVVCEDVVILAEDVDGIDVDVKQVRGPQRVVTVDRTACRQ